MKRRNGFVGNGSSIGTAARTVVERLEGRLLLAAQLLDVGEFRGRPGQFGNVNGVTLFTATDFPDGQMLWQTDGTSAGTRMVKDLDPQSSLPGQWFVSARNDALTVGDTMYFTGVTNAHGRELWRTDGTPEGTRMVADLVPGAGDSNPEGFVALGNQLIFTADKKLWRTDGTAGGTVMLRDADPLGSWEQERMAAMGDHVYFTTYPSHAPYYSRHPTGQLWRTDGTPQGTVMIRDVSPQPFDPTGSNPQHSGLININNTLYFAAHDGDRGWEPFRSDGTKRGTFMIRDIAPPPTDPNIHGSYPQNLTDVGGTLFFSADGFLWKSDGTSKGTIKLKTVDAARGFVNVNGTLYFSSFDALWKSDGTREGTVQVADVRPAEYFGPAAVATLNGRMFFGAGGGDGFELYETDGSSARTTQIYDLSPGAESSHAQVLGQRGERLVFTARSESNAKWRVYGFTLPRPHAPRDLSLHASTDTGISDTDRVTNINRPSVGGFAPDDSIVRVFANNREIGSTVARGGRFQISSSLALGEGTHTLTATATDDLGRASARSEPTNIRIDATSPRVRVTALSRQVIEMKFTKNVRATLAAEHITLQNLQTRETIPASAMLLGYDDVTNVATLSFHHFTNGLPQGRYRLTIDSAAVTDIAGNALATPTAVEFNPPGGPSIAMTERVLRITGSDASEEILLRLKSDEPTRLEVSVNGEISSHPVAGISGIRIDAMGGNDLVQFDHSNGTVKIPSTIYGGAGDDTIHGSAHIDRIYGGDGNDLIYGSGGNDILYGEAGADTIMGGHGNDYIVAGSGRNVVYGNHGTNRLFVNVGTDQVFATERDLVRNIDVLT